MDIRHCFRTRFRPWSLRMLAAMMLAAAPFATPAQDLAPGEYQWIAEPAGDGRVVIVVSLPEQRMHVYRNGSRIAVSTISSGRPGHETPTGVFEVLEKKRTHFSNRYDNAPMPFMQRLTWDGIALHAGRLPGYPDSHGCIRLPRAFAEQLFSITEKETIVVVADEFSHGPEVVFPGERAPVNPVTGLAVAPREPGPGSRTAQAPAMPGGVAE